MAAAPGTLAIVGAGWAGLAAAVRACRSRRVPSSRPVGGGVSSREAA